MNSRLENRNMNCSTVVNLVFCLAIAATAVVHAEPNIAVTANHAFLKFDLSAKSMDLHKAMRFRNSDGQFEVRIKPDKFPVPAPNCKTSIIARMPSTLDEQGQDEITKKKRLFDLIQAARSDKSKVVVVKLDLKPYVKIIRSQPFEGELLYCNVFFAPISDQPSLTE